MLRVSLQRLATLPKCQPLTSACALKTIVTGFPHTLPTTQCSRALTTSALACRKFEFRKGTVVNVDGDKEKALPTETDTAAAQSTDNIQTANSLESAATGESKPKRKPKQRKKKANKDSPSEGASEVTATEHLTDLSATESTQASEPPAVAETPKSTSKRSRRKAKAKSDEVTVAKSDNDSPTKSSEPKEVSTSVLEDNTIEVKQTDSGILIQSGNVFTFKTAGAPKATALETADAMEDETGYFKDDPTVAAITAKPDKNVSQAKKQAAKKRDASSAAKADTVRKEVAQDVWACVSCGFPQNFAQRTTCYRCMEPKDGVQDQPKASLYSETTLGLFSAEGVTPIEPASEVDDEHFVPLHRRTMQQNQTFIAKPRNEWEAQMLTMDRQWKFPIDNEQDLEEDKTSTFEDHVFLDHWLDEFAHSETALKHMELVITGLQQNPYMTSQQKVDVIKWHKDYFKEENLRT